MQQPKNDYYLKGLSEGNIEIIKTIYSKSYPGVQKFILQNKGSVQDAEETFHDALYQLSARYKTRNFEIKSTFEGYLYIVCRNIWRKELNRRKKVVRNEGVIELHHKEEAHSNNIIEQERWELFEEKMELLSDNCRKLLNDFFNKVSYSDIVQKFNYSCENVAFQRMFKCKKRLADLIKKDVRFKELS